MVLDELDMLQRLNHTHIVKFVDLLESRVCGQLLHQEMIMVP